MDQEYCLYLIVQICTHISTREYGFCCLSYQEVNISIVSFFSTSFTLLNSFCSFVQALLDLIKRKMTNWLTSHYLLPYHREMQVQYQVQWCWPFSKVRININKLCSKVKTEVSQPWIIQQVNTVEKFMNQSQINQASRKH